MNIALGKVGHRWAVIIPKAVRTGFVRGEGVLLLRDGNNILIRKASLLENAMKNGTQAIVRKAANIRSVAQKVKAIKAHPVALPKRDKFGHFLPAKKTSHSKNAKAH